MNDFHINDLGLKIIKDSESLRLKAYKDGGGVLTIGWGHTKGVKSTDIITREQADEYLKQDVDWAEHAVKDLVLLPLTENQFSALVSLVFNIGREAFKKSSLIRRLNYGDVMAAAGQFPAWRFDNGKEEPGLLIRRRKEQTLFLTKDTLKQ
jgi:lysozyme